MSCADICHNEAYGALSTRCHVIRRPGGQGRVLWSSAARRLHALAGSLEALLVGRPENRGRFPRSARPKLGRSLPGGGALANQVATPPAARENRQAGGGGGKRAGRAPACVSEFPGLDVFGGSRPAIPALGKARVREGARVTGTGDQERNRETEPGRVREGAGR